MGAKLCCLQPDKQLCLDDFVIESLLGQGGFAAVYSALLRKSHPGDPHRVAVKVLMKAKLQDEKHQRMVLQELHLLKHLRHPQMATLQYAFQDDANVYLAMDCCRHGDLYGMLSRMPMCRMTEEQVKFIAVNVLLFFQYAHQRGVVHRDIKPENILLDSRGYIKMTDFGISTHSTNGSCTSTSGTRPYMAPEVFLPGHVHNSIADYYSLGVTLFQLLCGQRPYPGSRRVLQMIVRMVSFVPPLSITKPSRIRRTLFSAQQRRAPVPELQFMARLSRLPSACRAFIGSLLVANPRYRLGCHGAEEVLKHEWLAGVDVDGIRAGTATSPLPLPPLPAQSAASDTQMRAAWALLATQTEQTSPDVHLPEFYFSVDDPVSLVACPDLLASVPPDLPAQQMARHMHSGASASTPAAQVDTGESGGKDGTRPSAKVNSAQSAVSDAAQSVQKRPTSAQSSSKTSGTSDGQSRRAVDVPALAKELRAFREESLVALRGRRVKQARPQNVMQGFLTSANAAAKVMPENLLLGGTKVVHPEPLRQLGQEQAHYGALRA